MMFTILMVTKLFAMAKGKGVIKAWQATVDKIELADQQGDQLQPI
jgi:hypothetical protein